MATPAPQSAALPPGPSGSFRLHTMFAMRRRVLAFLTDVKQQYGDVVYTRVGKQRMFILFHPEMIKEMLIANERHHLRGRVLRRSKMILGEGLLTSEGEFHLRQRRLTQPAFHRDRILGYGRVMSEYAARFRERWRDGEVLDIHREMNRLTLLIVGKTLFDADVESDAEQIGRGLTDFMAMFPLIFLPFSKILERLPIPPMRRLRQSMVAIDKIIYRLIEERRRDGRDHGDLLSMLLAAQDQEGGTGRMNDKQVRDECLTLLLAGHDTTANALTWTWYLLAQNPEKAQKLYAEIDSVLAGRAPQPEDLARLPYTEMVFAESMRLFPPAWGVARTVEQPYEMTVPEGADLRGGPRTFQLPRGALVLTSQFVVQRDARWWPEPETFLPERWASAEGERGLRPATQNDARPRFAYFPFGGGGRQCIGESFAWMEGRLLLAAIAQQWKMHLMPEPTVVPLPVITLRPKYGIGMRLERRNQPAAGS